MSLVKICSNCSTHNINEDEMCVRCGSDISAIQPVSIDSTQSQNAIKVDPDKVLDKPCLLTEDGTTIELKEATFGREGIGSNLITDKLTISRKHAKFWKIGTKWYLEDLGSANGTYINDKQIQPNEKNELNNGDKISFSSSVHLRVYI